MQEWQSEQDAEYYKQAVYMCGESFLGRRWDAGWLWLGEFKSQIRDSGGLQNK